MPIPKQIFQTFKTKKLSWITRYHVARLKRMNPEYEYHFYDDEMIIDFFKEEFPPEYLKAYQRITIGAAKADFFRYAVLYKKGGIYLDLDAKLIKPFRKFIFDDDEAVLSHEINDRYFVQWALMFAPGHPFLKKTLEMALDNIQQRRYPRDGHASTGPTVFSNAIRACLQENENIPYRLYGVYYNKDIREKYMLAKLALYRNKKNHWKKLQLQQDVISAE